MSQRLSLRCEPIDRLEACVSEASCVPAGSAAKAGDQVRYLASYLRNPEIAAKAIIVEKPYVDRHWLEEYAGYYATLLDPPPPKATRLHFLDVGWSTEQFMAQLDSAIEQREGSDVAKHYIGFAVIRPLPAAPLGRTVIRPYRHVAERCFAPAELVHRVHLAGLTIKVEGLPFQQQDQGVAACATTALWSALTKVIRSDGGRAPTPYAVTLAATDQHIQARAFPALGGLDLEQMASAIHAFGYQPHVFQRAGAADDFVLALKTYVRSGLPVVVRARVQDRDLHAFTLVGYRERSKEQENAIDFEIKSGDQVKLRARGIVRWYSHDDRFGAYGRLGFLDDEGERRHTRLKLLPTEEGFEHLETPMVFSDAIVPLYPKLRLTAEELIAYAIDLSPAVRVLAREESNLHVNLQFALAGEYLSHLHRRPLDRHRIVHLCTTLALSRYVGVISWYRDDEWVLDAVYDTTDLRRGDTSRPPLLALVPRNAGWIAQLEKFRSLRFGDTPLIA